MMVKKIVTILSATARQKIQHKHWPPTSGEPCNRTDVFMWKLLASPAMKASDYSLQHKTPPRCIKYFGKTPTCKNRRSGNRSPLARVCKMSRWWLVTEIRCVCAAAVNGSYSRPCSKRVLLHAAVAHALWPEAELYYQLEPWSGGSVQTRFRSSFASLLHFFYLTPHTTSSGFMVSVWSRIYV